MSIFFLRICIGESPNQFRALLRDQEGHQSVELTAETVVPSGPGPGEAIVAFDEAKRALDGLAPPQRKALLARGNAAEVRTQAAMWTFAAHIGLMRFWEVLVGYGSTVSAGASVSKQCR
ncbi:hypothetical protein [Actinoplanes regularis]|uniref:hypothetical protein n=1 Tax=Actinoplanes regularis TaxID=52697 RepID=UPI001178CB41|nr:hypothetical protein [Actinoplanes regularis]GIE91570.1 hypothetical protein Are01nite_80500 [Actinoplanes regularis]